MTFSYLSLSTDATSRPDTLLLRPVGKQNARLEKCNCRDYHIRVPVSTAEHRGSRKTHREVLGDVQELNLKFCCSLSSLALFAVMTDRDDLKPVANHQLCIARVIKSLIFNQAQHRVSTVV
jgi:hypothetical protein